MTERTADHLPIQDRSPAGYGGPDDAELPLAPPRTDPWRWARRAAWIAGGLTLLGLVAWGEMRASPIEARIMASYGGEVSFAMQPGPNPALYYPKAGPYNDRLGYSYLPFFIKALRADDFAVTAQAHASASYEKLLRHGFYPIYKAKTVAGLSLFDRTGMTIYHATYPRHVFDSFDDIPHLLTDSLLYIENRDLLKDGPVTRNPVIEWGRFFYAFAAHVGHVFIHGSTAGGGSTLATQIEKFRYSPQGQTGSGMEKIRQIMSASMRVYMDGIDTRDARRQIVLDYLNSTPLSARPGFGEINSIGDGLWAWFGYDLTQARRDLDLPEDSAAHLAAKGGMYRAALALILAQRRPSYYLQTDRPALDKLIDGTLDRLRQAGIISPALAAATRHARLHFLAQAPEPPQPPYIEQKAVNSLRTHLMTMLGLRKLYEVDRLDLTARTTLDQPAQAKLVDFLKQMGNCDFVESIGLYGFRLLKPANDPAKIKWSVVLYERGSDSNRLRLQADNIDEPFDMNEGMKLDLGSTAKLRTLTTYLEIVAELHRRYAGLDADDLRDLSDDAPDALTGWVTGYLTDHPDADLETTLNAAMDRTYSGNPGEVFFTGGGIHVFHNFERSEDGEVMDLHEAFRKSVNLVFVRVMRDIVNYTIAQGPQTKDDLLGDSDEPGRQAYLQRFADQEGTEYLSRYIASDEKLSPAARLDAAAERGHKGAVSRTVLFRSVAPEADFDAYRKFMRAHAPRESVSDERLAQLYDDYPVTRFSLADRAYLSGLNPMELWLLATWHMNPHESRRDLIAASQPVRQESYAWLFSPKRKHAQDTRIRIMLEQEAFIHIQKRWARLGYPFDRLTPSYATAIGSSGDRPGALSELVGIILAEGRKYPTERFETLEFGSDTPYDTLLKHDETVDAPQVLDPAIAHVMKAVMSEVVEDGTAKKVRDVYISADGNPLAIGGKTGTGDQRYEEFARGGHLKSSRVLNRTGTFAFYIGDRFFGTITAHVAGSEAASYVFTSALSAQMLAALAPIINPLVNGTVIPAAPPAPTDGAAPPATPSPAPGAGVSPQQP